MALGSTQPLTEMSTRNLPGGKKRPASVSRMSENVGASTSRKPRDLDGLYRDNLPYYSILSRRFFFSDKKHVNRLIRCSLRTLTLNNLCEKRTALVVEGLKMRGRSGVGLL
jgi:hypothetical protein